MAFLGGIFDRIGDLADSVTGKTDSNNLKAQIEQQRLMNEQIIKLQQQEVAYKETPEYLAARQKRIYVGCFLLVLAMACALFLLNKKE